MNARCGNRAPCRSHTTAAAGHLPGTGGGLDNVASCSYIVVMKTVGLRELKNNLSRYVRRVQAGEAVAITDRGLVIAELTPPQPKENSISILKEMAQRGEIILARPMTKERHAVLASPRPSVLKGVTAQDLLDEERGER